MAARPQQNQGGNRPYGNHGHQDQAPSFTKMPEQQWVREDAGFDQNALEYCNDFGKYLADNGLNTTQLRNVFGEMRRIQLKKSNVNAVDGLYTQFLLLQPRVLYQAKRAGGNWERVFTEQFLKLAKMVRKDAFYTDFDRFMNIQEAILAYHKYHGGKDKL